MTADLSGAGHQCDQCDTQRDELRRARIMIVDDDQLTVVLLERILRQRGFQRVESATDAEAGLEMILRDGADLLLLDLHMPSTDGFAVMHRLRDALTPDERPAVLMLTSDVAVEVKEQALALGVRDFLTKPFPPVETVLRVENLLEVRLLTRRLAEENTELSAAAAKRAAELAMVMHAAADAIIGIDEHERITSWNRGAEALFGWQEDAIAGAPFSTLVPGRYHEDYVEIVSGLRAKNPEDIQGGGIELPGLREDGTEFPAELSLAGGNAAGGTFYVAVVRDITARKQAEQADRARLELEQSVADIRVTMATAESLAEALAGCAGLLVRHLDVAFTGIWLASGNGALELTASAGVHTDGELVDARERMQQVEIGRIATRHQPHLTNDVASEEEVGGLDWAEREGLVAFAGYPLETDARPLGVMAVLARRALEPDMLRALDTIAAEVASGIARRQAREALEAEQVFVASLLESLQEGIIACDAEGRITVFNETARRWYGGAVTVASPDEWADAYSFFQADGVTRMKTEDIPLYRSLQGVPVRDVEMVLAPHHLPPVAVVANGKPLHDERGRMTGAVVAFHDVTDRQRVEAELQRRTFRDTLTGIPNRALFLDRIDRDIGRVDPDRPRGGIVLLGLDNFKLVNDSLGQEVGDRILTEVAQRIEAAVAPAHTAARVGGDEFGVLCDDSTDEQQVFHLAAQAAAAVAEPLDVDGRRLHLTASAGVALFRDPARPASMILSDAESAMYRAKARGRGGIEAFDQDLRAAAMARLEIENALPGAVDRGELVVHYQPEVRLDDCRITAVEALVRWEHPGRGRIPPDEFIPVAEDTGMIIPIGRWILGEACRSGARWARENPNDPITVAVNLSARQLEDPTLVDVVRDLVTSTGIDPGLLSLEITESVLMTDAESSVQVLRNLKSVGVRLAVDDFGTGYSSLSYLKQFPVDYLKIDRSFVDGLGRDPEDTAIVEAVMGVARALGLAVIAEGVETDLQLGELQRLGCDLGQGWLWSKAVPAAELDTLLAARAPLGV